MDIIHSSDTLFRMLGEDQEDFITPGTGNIKSIKCLIPLPCTSTHVESPSGGQSSKRLLIFPCPCPQVQSSPEAGVFISGWSLPPPVFLRKQTPLEYRKGAEFVLFGDNRALTQQPSCPSFEIRSWPASAQHGLAPAQGSPLAEVLHPGRRNRSVCERCVACTKTENGHY